MITITTPLYLMTIIAMTPRNKKHKGRMEIQLIMRKIHIHIMRIAITTIAEKLK